MSYLLIDAGGIVVNVIVVDAASAYTPPAGYAIEPRTGAEWIGWRRLDGTWTPPDDQATA